MPTEKDTPPPAARQEVPLSNREKLVILESDQALRRLQAEQAKKKEAKPPPSNSS